MNQNTMLTGQRRVKMWHQDIFGEAFSVAENDITSLFNL